jgi:uncharacterized protein YndB with AHSA1/START domain
MDTITIETTINAPVQKVWDYWTLPEHITKWCQASADWHAPYAENDVREGGKFKTTMAAKDGSASFDFEGVYTEVRPHEYLAYKMDDGRTVRIQFEDIDGTTKIIEEFDPEALNPLEMQRTGWQSILNTMKTYTETH